MRLQFCPVAAVGWWWMVVIYILSFPHFQRSLLKGLWHGACLWVTPPCVATSWFVFVCRAHCASFRCVLAKRWETKSKDESNCATNVRNLAVKKKNARKGWATTEKITHRSRTDGKWTWEAGNRNCIDSIRKWKNKPKHAKTSRMPKTPVNQHSMNRTALQVKGQMLDLYIYI